MVLNNICNLKGNKNPLQLVELPVVEPGDREILVRVLTCGVCHTELDEIEGRAPPSKPCRAARNVAGCSCATELSRLMHLDRAPGYDINSRTISVV